VKQLETPRPGSHVSRRSLVSHRTIACAQVRGLPVPFALARRLQIDLYMTTSWIFALAGGGLIGGAAALLFLTHGRIAGISGIVGSLLPPAATDRDWRLAFVAGLLVAGVVGARLVPAAVGASVRGLPLVVLAGLLVGFGTRMGSGCTSGHGVCGLSRWSSRSMVAVATFMVTGAIAAWLGGVVS
jgi:uncharacterized membrane protein YedE/YeeE